MLETDVLSQRVELMEKALYEMIEVNRVSGEAQQAVSKSNEMVYREEALKRQIEFLQKQLDDMHPENVPEVRTGHCAVRHERHRGKRGAKSPQPHEAGGPKRS